MLSIRSRTFRAQLATIGTMLLLLPAGGIAAAQLLARNLDELSLEELAQIEVTSVSRRPESVARAAAAIYVITADDIRRSGAATLAEAMRLAPNLQVSRLDAGLYGISARGFNSNISNKLLVMIDGRTVYSPLFSGVFWDSQDVMLEDVERIEVISGPAGSTWGANAVNGVINVITRSAHDTQGALAAVQGGNRESIASARYGGTLDNGGAYRVYGKHWETDEMTRNGGNGTTGAWRRGQGGFRTDWQAGGDRFTFQGDASSGQSGLRSARGAGEVSSNLYNLLGRWTRQHGDGSETQVQAYVDRTEHMDQLLLDESGDIFDVDARHRTQWGAHSLQFGGGYRYARDSAQSGTLFSFLPAGRTLSWTNVFAQDQMALRPDLQLTLGARLEKNDYTGWEFLPNARLGWQLDDKRFVWSSLSRTVRAPARIDREIFTPSRPPFIVAGGPDFQSEVANVLELGYRAQPTATLSYSVTAFRQAYSHLRSGELSPAGGLPITFQNRAHGHIDGLETWGYWQATRAWRLSAGLTSLHANFQRDPGSTDAAGPRNLGNNPDLQWMLRSSLNLPGGAEFDVMLRHVRSLGPFPNAAVITPAYTALDLRYAWNVARNLQLAFVVQNAFDPYHREWGDTTSSAEVSRMVGLKALWRM